MVQFLEQNKHRLTTIQAINAKLFNDFQEEEQLNIAAIDDVFCDGMYFPRTKLTDTIAKVKELFEEVELVAKRVKDSANDKYWFVKLCEDSTPTWSVMKMRLLRLMQNLRHKLKENVCLLQLDRTQDFRGYFVCNNLIEFASCFSSVGFHKSPT